MDGVPGMGSRRALYKEVSAHVAYTGEELPRLLSRGFRAVINVVVEELIPVQREWYADALVMWAKVASDADVDCHT
jgi:hypothetical protein